MTAPPPSDAASSRPPPPRRKGVREFLQGPRLVDHRGFWFVIAIFLLVIVVFAVAFYAFLTTLQPPAPAPIVFTQAFMIAGNATFNVTSVADGPYPWTGFGLNFSINNFWGVAVPLATSGYNATFSIGTSSHKDTYHVEWIDRDHDGSVSVGDSFWVWGDGVGLPGLSYCQLNLIWRSGAWTAIEYWVTSTAIV